MTLDETDHVIEIVALCKIYKRKNEVHREKIASDFPTLCTSGVSLLKIQNSRNFYLLSGFDK
jgi:hypothetical protein